MYFQALIADLKISLIFFLFTGPDPDIRRGPSNLAKGPRKSASAGSTLAKGPNPEKRKGPQGLNMGSIFLQKKADAPNSRTR